MTSKIRQSKVDPLFSCLFVEKNRQIRYFDDFLGLEKSRKEKSVQNQEIESFAWCSPSKKL